MVDFIVFNELSLPFKNNISINEKFISFLFLLENIRSKGLKKIRTTKNFKNYQILDKVYLQEFFGQVKDEVLKKKILSFMNNGFVILDSPLIKNEEIEEQNQTLENEYFYQKESIVGGLACSHIWDTIAVSFHSSTEWDKESIIFQKQNILDEQEIDIEIRHASKVKHLEEHKSFFEDLEAYQKLGITKENFWEKKEKFFPHKIIFCKEIEKQIKKIDKKVFDQAIGILLNVEKNRKEITDYNYSGESKSVCEDKKLKNIRIFTYKHIKIQFNNHIKSLPNANRIYFLEHENKIYIGYIGKHLPTKKFK